MSQKELIEKLRDAEGENVVICSQAADEIERLNRRVAELLETTNRYLQDKRDAKTELAGTVSTHDVAAVVESATPFYPDRTDLRDFGWARGNYMSRCLTCYEVHYDCDKRARSCWSCAKAEMNAWNALTQTERHERAEKARTGR